jgi:hypothetical protein
MVLSARSERFLRASPWLMVGEMRTVHWMPVPRTRAHAAAIRAVMPN